MLLNGWMMMTIGIGMAVLSQLLVVTNGMPAAATETGIF